MLSLLSALIQKFKLFAQNHQALALRVEPLKAYVVNQSRADQAPVSPNFFGPRRRFWHTHWC